MQTLIPKGYQAPLSLIQTEVAIKEIKDFFERRLADTLDLTRVSAPLFVMKDTGLNDNLNGVERPVSFDILEHGADSQCEIVHSLAKWKRYALKRYSFSVGKGIYTDMNAIRRDETTDNLHSLYVDQWDWEKIINEDDRSLQTLENVVSKIFTALKDTEKLMSDKYGYIKTELPESIKFITSQELEDMYPTLDPNEREERICREYGAVFIMQIGGALRSGKRHDGRAPDYDDWSLNGDIIVHYPLLNKSVELSSMGIRVDADALKRQLDICGSLEKLKYPFHQAIVNNELPYTIGGGIGQSRLCMYFLRKAHIGEVQTSVWTDETVKLLESAGVNIL